MSIVDGGPLEPAGTSLPSAGASMPPPGFAIAERPAVAPLPVQAPRRLPPTVLALVAGGVILAAVAVVVAAGGIGGTSPELAIAKAIVLRASDVPGFTVEPSQPNPAGKELQARARSCPGAQGLGQHSGEVKASSPQFQSGRLQVSSEADIERSSGIVASDFALLRTGRIQSCLRQVFDGLAVPASNGVVITVSGVRLTPLALPVGGAHESFGLRVGMVFSALGRSVPFTMDIFGYGVGHDEVSLTTFSVAQPFPTQAEQQLSTLLVTRALAHPH